jgi:hypothetical protein
LRSSDIAQNGFVHHKDNLSFRVKHGIWKYKLTSTKNSIDLSYPTLSHVCND